MMMRLFQSSASASAFAFEHDIINRSNITALLDLDDDDDDDELLMSRVVFDATSEDRHSHTEAETENNNGRKRLLNCLVVRTVSIGGVLVLEGFGRVKVAF
jgi:hypothetical protein